MLNESVYEDYEKNFNYPIFRLKGSVFLHIWKELIAYTLFVVLITCLYNFGHLTILGLNPAFITITSLVLSLILAFRTNTAYDRYWEGRKLWGQQTTAVRNLARYVWANAKTQSKQDLEIKKLVINLLIAYPFSVKHYLRGELKYKAAQIDIQTHLTSAINDHVSSEILLEDDDFSPVKLSHRIGMTFQYIKVKDIVDVQIWTAIQNALMSLVDALAGFERIRTTPLPAAYALHIIHILWVYLLFLPFECLPLFGWASIPVCLLAAFCFLGAETLGKEIENPFGLDDNDLPLENLCLELKEELLEVVKTEAAPPPWLTSMGVAKS